MPLIALPVHDDFTKATLKSVDGVLSFVKALTTLGVRGDMEGLKTYFMSNPEDELDFFSPGGTYQAIVDLAFSLPRLLERVPGLKAGTDAKVVFTQRQVAALLANGFLCRFPDSSSPKLVGINMQGLFDRSNNEKLRCMLHYFSRVSRHLYTASQHIVFHRRHLSRHPSWSESKDKIHQDGICDVTVSATGTIEDSPPEQFLHADFANRTLGGGVLSRGLVQEEIRFLICPELLAGRLVCGEWDLRNDEVVVCSGVERFSTHSGYGYETFQWTGDYQDKTIMSSTMPQVRATTVVAFDALSFAGKKNVASQFQMSNVERELLKAYCAFFVESDELTHGQVRPMCTGNWGAGVFLGDIQLKFVVQVMAAAVARRRLLYLTWGNKAFADECVGVLKMLKGMGATVADVHKALSCYDKSVSVFEHLFAHFIGPLTQ